MDRSPKSGILISLVVGKKLPNLNARRVCPKEISNEACGLKCKESRLPENSRDVKRVSDGERGLWAVC